MARTPLLASLLVAACSVPNPYFGVSSGASATDGASTTTTSSSTGEPLPTTGASAAVTTSTVTTDDLTGAATLPPPPDLPSDNPISTTTAAATTTSTTDASSSSSGDDSSDGGDGSDESDTEMVIDLPACDPGAAALIACYDFDVVDALVDSALKGHDGTLFNGAAFPGFDGQALKVSMFTIGMTTTKPDLSPETITLSAWVRLTQAPPELTGVIVEKRQQYSLGVGLDGPTCTIGQDMTVDANMPLPLGEWTHVACTYKDGELVVYVDGKPVATTSDDMAEIGAGINPLNVGCGGPGCSRRLLNANIDRVQLWKIRLDDADLCAEAGPNCP